MRDEKCGMWNVKFLIQHISFHTSHPSFHTSHFSFKINILSINGISKSGHKFLDDIEDVDELFVLVEVHAHTLGCVTVVNDVTPYIIGAFNLPQYIGKAGVVEEEFTLSPTGIVAGRNAVHVHPAGRGNEDELVVGREEVVAGHAAN